MDSFITDFTNMDITYIEADTNVDNNYQKFFQDINLLLDNHVPIKRCTKKESKFKLKEWINTKIKKMMRIRDSILGKLKRNRSENNLKCYRKFRNRVTAEIKTSKIHYFHNYFSTNSQNMCINFKWEIFHSTSHNRTRQLPSNPIPLTYLLQKTRETHT